MLKSGQNTKLIMTRDMEKTDVEILYQQRFSGYVHDNFGGNIPTMEEHMKWVEQSAGIKNHFTYGIYNDNKLIGGCSLKNISFLNRNAEFDLFIDHQHIGNGYGKAALKQLLKIGFEDMELHRIYAYLLETNTGALKLYTDIGFNQEGLLKENVLKGDKYLNSLLISLLKSKYEDRH
jgi:RimJ/RimL family protein N-acetyltransferase